MDTVTYLEGEYESVPIAVFSPVQVTSKSVFSSAFLYCFCHDTCSPRYVTGNVLASIGYTEGKTIQ